MEQIALPLSVPSPVQMWDYLDGSDRLDDSEGMGMRAIEAERVAADMLGRQSSADGAPDLGEVLRRVLGPDALRVVPRRALPKDGAISRVDGQWFVFVRERLPETRLRWVCAHELGELAIRRLGYRPANREESANAIAGAILAPPGAFSRAWRSADGNAPAVARELRISQSCAWLRCGEVLELPLALVAASVRFRGTGWEWPPEGTVRAMATGKASPGLRRVRLSDHSGRVVLAATG